MADNVKDIMNIDDITELSNGLEENNDYKKKEKEYKDEKENLFADSYRLFKKNVLSSDSGLLDKDTLQFLQSPVFDEALESINSLLNNIGGIKPPYISDSLNIMFDSVTKKIKEMKEKNIINENESIGNIFVKGYMDSIVKAAKEKGVNVTKDELYFYFVFKPIQENFEIFKEAVMKITGMDEETLERNMFEIQAPEELEKDQRIKGLESFLKSIDVYNIEAPSMLFSTGLADELRKRIAKEDSIFFFSMEDFLKKNSSALKDYVFNDALKLNFNDFIEKNAYGNKKLAKKVLRDSTLSLKKEGVENFAVLEDEGNIALPAFYLKKEYLEKCNAKPKYSIAFFGLLSFNKAYPFLHKSSESSELSSNTLL